MKITKGKFQTPFTEGHEANEGKTLSINTKGKREAKPDGLRPDHDRKAQSSLKGTASGETLLTEGHEEHKESVSRRSGDGGDGKGILPQGNPASGNVGNVMPDAAWVQPRSGVATSSCIQPGEFPNRAAMPVDNLLGADRTADQKAHAAQVVNEALVRLRQYQTPVFMDRESGILILHWSRQIGKSYTLASWAVDRLLSQLAKGYDSWLITVLSNSRDNGAEFVVKCGEVCNKMGIALERQAKVIGDAAVYVDEDHSPDLKYENMRMEVRVTVGGKIGRIKVLAANPRTARGFSGDLILDEFAFHEDSNAIWEAAEPILSANPEFLCRIASTGNGKHNMFYRMSSGPGANNGDVFASREGFKVSRVTRSEANKMGVKIYDRNTRKPITPEEARKQALDKRAYDQNYECQFTDENMALLTHELISAAEREGITIDSQEWTPASIARMYRAIGDLETGVDVGRNRDLTVVTVIERRGTLRKVIAMLRMAGLRLPLQQKQLDVVCMLPKFRRMEIDMTGIGLGLFEYTQEKWGAKINGVNFSSSEPVSERIVAEGRKAETAKVTEIMATDLAGVFEDRAIEIPADTELRDDLRKPEKITSPGGKVSIAATRDEAGHADHFWSLALAVRAGNKSGGPFAYQSIRPENLLETRIRAGRFTGVLCRLIDRITGLIDPRNLPYKRFGGVYTLLSQKNFIAERATGIAELLVWPSEVTGGALS